MKKLIIGFILFTITMATLAFTHKDTYTEYIVVDKGQNYSYHKNSATQHNILILRNIKDNTIKAMNVKIETHYVAKVGESITFKDDKPDYFVIWFIGGLIIFAIMLLVLIFEGLS